MASAAGAAAAADVRLPEPRLPVAVLKTDSYSFCPFAVLRSSFALQSVSGSSATPTPRPAAAANSTSLLGVALRDAKSADSASASATAASGISVAAADGEHTDLVICPGETPSDVCVWDVRTNRLAQRAVAQTDALKTGMCMSLRIGSASGALMACGYESGHLGVFDLRRLPDALTCAQLHREPRAYTVFLLIRLLLLFHVHVGRLCILFQNACLFISSSIAVLSFDVNSAFTRGMSGSADAQLCCFALEAVGSSVCIERRIELPVAGSACVRLRASDEVCVSVLFIVCISSLFNLQVTFLLSRVVQLHSVSLSAE